MILKNENVRIRKVEIAQIFPFSFDDNESEEDDFLDYEEEEEELEEPILLHRFDVKLENAGAYIYSFEFEGLSSQIPESGEGDETTEETETTDSEGSASTQTESGGNKDGGSSSSSGAQPPPMPQMGGPK